jgi:hypothetical protein
LLQLRNLSGQVVYEQKVVRSDEQIEFALETSHEMSTGIYVLTVRTSGGVINEKLFLNY